MELPIYNHLDLGFNYQFVYNKFYGKVDNELRDNDLLIFTCMRVNQSTNAFDGYFLFGFDITKSRHDTLLFKERLNIT